MTYDLLDLTVLKHITTHKKHGMDFVSECEVKLFNSETWNFANIVFNYLKTYKELPTLRILTEKLQKGGNGEKLSEYVVKVWNEIDKINVDEKEYIYEVERLKKRFADKQILTLRDNLIKQDPNNLDLNRVVSDLQKNVNEIKDLNKTKLFERKTLKDAIPEFKEEYNAKLHNPNINTGIKTGYSFLDQTIGGFQSGEMCIIAGESGSFKSTMLMNIAINIWCQSNTINTIESQYTQGYDVVFVSLEMPFKVCLNRSLAKISQVPVKSIRDSNLKFDEADRLKKSLRFINKYPFNFEIIDIPRGCTMSKIESIIEEIKINYNPKVIAIDYLGLMDLDNKKDMEDWLKLGFISEVMHEYARVNECIVLSAVQLNRNISKEAETRIGLHRVGRSSSILHNANIAIQIDKRINEGQYVDLQYHIIKSRDSELGMGTMLKNLSCATLLDNPVEENEKLTDIYNMNDISEKIELLD